MKYKAFHPVALLVGLFFLASYTYQTHHAKKEKVLMQVIMESLDKAHYKTTKLDDDFSKKTFDLYLERLDYNKRFLTAADVKKLKEYETQIDDELMLNSLEFFHLSAEMIEKRMKEAETYSEEILANPFDFDKNEIIEFDPEKQEYPKNEKAVKERWRKLLKYQVLTNLVDKLEEQEKAQEDGIDTVEIKSIEQLEVKAREKVAKRQKDYFRRLNQLEIDDRRTVYINAITSAYDPHTGYFPPKDKEDFDIAMSGQLEGIGATLTEKNGYITVTRIVAGSPCWKQGDLEVNDKIVMVAQGKEEPVDVVDMRLDKAVKLIRGKKGTEVRLTVKKIDGTKTIIPIIRDVVILEETYAKSCLLKAKGSKEVGYIKLPKFYADFNRTGARNCAADIEKELEKVQKEGAKSVILDLRNNGGGSLDEAVKMAGLFIEKGPIVQVRSRAGAPRIYSDKDKRIQYDGPLVVMVNSFSASASEIVAAALQDYERAVIVGSPTTFGKGTVQRFIDLDRILPPEYADVKPLGAIKLTTQKFYRINGGATQLKGVTPDVILPDNYELIETGEKEQDYPMPWDEIKPLDYSRWNQNPRFDKLRKNSTDRIEENGVFKLISENAHRLKDQRDDTNYSLNLETYRAEQKTRKDEAKRYKDIRKKIEDFDIQSLKVDLPKINSDSTKIKLNEEWHTNLQKDAHLYEAVEILKDLK